MQIIMNTNFIKNGSRILTMPSGLNYNLNIDVAYKLCFDGWEGVSYLTEISLPKIPEKCYTKSIDKFIDKILINFNDSDKSTLGVLLTGLKGSGKTLTAKRLALRSGLPIIVIDEKYPADKLTQFFANVKQEVCILFDELDKNTRFWETSKLLSFLDGIENICKKLVIFTCNDTKVANENLIDRCSRIRYFREYKGLSDEEINDILNDLLLYHDKLVDCKECINDIAVKSYDNIISFINEVNNYRDENPYDLLNDLNISLK